MKKLLMSAVMIVMAGGAYAAEFGIQAMKTGDIEHLAAAVSPVSAASLCDISRKGGEPPKIEPVLYNGAKFSIDYEITPKEFTANMVVTKGGKPWYTDALYIISINPNLEADIQWDFVVSMKREYHYARKQGSMSYTKKEDYDREVLKITTQKGRTILFTLP